MKKQKHIPSVKFKNGLPTIKIQLDLRTSITVSSLKAVEFWRQRYPNLKIIG